MPELTRKDPRLKAAQDDAEQCAPDWKPPEETPAPDPSGPLPEAADGKNTDACADGSCEVLVTSHANVTANGLTVDITVEEQLTTFRSGGSVMQLGGQSGEVEFGDDLKITIVAQNEEGAVLEFTPG
ncbi:hypothetical protein AN216_09520 [Streptomyces oceani]|uniref:Uncharacterized protein n=1 Tax=Streptomyces oceani TaxID=1075402 RepID=A0A1E7KJ76_9ACTN|nr:hypothetical protein AN216_09520 [Streptomyces oceani]